MAPAVALKDPYLESRVYGTRTVLVLVVVMVLMGILMARYFSLQITQYEIYRTESDRNRVQLQSLPPKRGLIYDRNGVLLAENRPSFVLSLVLERVPDLEGTLATLAELVEITESDLEKFDTRSHRRRPYEAVPLHFRLSEEERALLAVNRYRLPGVVVDAQLIRHYPQGELFSHALGYVGRINEEEQRQLDEVDYRGTNHVGKIGVEKYYEDQLHGDVGYQNVETNALGRVLRVLERTDPVPGADLTLSLDVGVQQAAYAALEGRRGAVVAIDPRNGELIALVSTPGFDSNLFVNGISGRDYSALREDRDLPLFNRAVQGQYPPGSTVKPIFGLAGLEYGLVTPETSIPDPGWYTLPGEKRRFRDWTLRVRGTGHGRAVDLHQAIEESCDVYFYDLAHRMGIDRLHDFTAPFGLGTATGLDTTNERSGILPSSQWKRAARGEVWFPGETLNVGIGQGYMLATPVQLAVATSVLASRGQYATPHLLREVNGEAVNVPTSSVVEADEAHWQVIHEAMHAVLHGERGSARAVGRNSAFAMAGKSGTAQVIGIAQDEEYDAEALEERYRDHGLFVAFAPYEDPQIAVAVVVENGGGGSTVAAPIAREVMEQYLLNRQQEVAERG
ncbi:MAG: penicillin-binding protein 2 [Halieaceae bacterium]|jgi:penicillin-binding protein 2|nr:penicillin-binding protein 2 [Halieaceae bacterium]